MKKMSFVLFALIVLSQLRAQSKPLATPVLCQAVAEISVETLQRMSNKKCELTGNFLQCLLAVASKNETSSKAITKGIEKGCNYTVLKVRESIKVILQSRQKPNFDILVKDLRKTGFKVVNQ